MFPVFTSFPEWKSKAFWYIKANSQQKVPGAGIKSVNPLKSEFFSLYNMMLQSESQMFPQGPNSVRTATGTGPVMAIPDTEGDAFPAVGQHSFRGAGLVGSRSPGPGSSLPAQPCGTGLSSSALTRALYPYQQPWQNLYDNLMKHLYDYLPPHRPTS